MNQVIENIFTRRSTRSFNDKVISREDMELLIQTGLYAPTGCCKESWQLTGLLNQDKLSDLVSIMRGFLNPNYRFYNAKSLIIVSNEASNPWGRDDDACALENIFLAAHSMGISSVWINQLSSDNCNRPEVRKFLTELGVPENHVVHGVAALGYSDEEPKGKIDKKGKFIIIE